MEPFTIRLPKPMLERLDSMVQEEGYASRSEAVRDAIRELVEGE